MKFKAGVSIAGIQPELLVGLALSEQVFRDWRVPLIVTSVTDGVHRHGSFHYSGLAVDLRSKHLERDILDRVVRALEDVLEPLGFQVLLEDEGQPNEHIHLEYQPTAAPAEPEVA